MISWSVPSLLERHRARVAERVGRVEKATERVQELDAEHAKLLVDMAEAKAHLAAKVEDLAAERAEVQKLESQLPAAPSASSGGPAATAPPPIDSDQPDAEQKIMEGVRRLAAQKGGAWKAMLAAAPVQPAPGQSQSEHMQVDSKGQNAEVTLAPPLSVSPTSGGNLALVPGLARDAEMDLGERAPKIGRRG